MNKRLLILKILNKSAFFYSLFLISLFFFLSIVEIMICSDRTWSYIMTFVFSNSSFSFLFYFIVEIVTVMTYHNNIIKSLW